MKFKDLKIDVREVSNEIFSFTFLAKLKLKNKDVVIAGNKIIDTDIDINEFEEIKLLPNNNKLLGSKQ